MDEAIDGARLQAGSALEHHLLNLVGGARDTGPLIPGAGLVPGPHGQYRRGVKLFAQNLEAVGQDRLPDVRVGRGPELRGRSRGGERNPQED